MHESPRPSIDYHQSVLKDDNTRRLLRIFIGLIFGGSLLYFIAAAFSSEQAGLRSAGIYLANVCALLALAQLRAGRTGRAVSLLIWGSWAALLIQVGISNGLMSRSLMAVPILIVLAGWLLKAREALLFYLATIFAGMLLALGTQAGLLPLLTSSAPPLLVWLAFSIYVVLAAAVAYHIFRGFRLRHEDLAERKAELDLLMHNVPSMIFHGGRDKRCLYANRAYVEFYDPLARNPVGKTVREIVGDQAYLGMSVDERLDRVLAGERLTYRGVRPSPGGEMRTLDIDLLPETGEAGAVTGFFAVIDDVTDSVHAEEELRRSEHKFASVFRSSPLAVAITRLEDGRYLDVNEAFVRLFGWTREEAIGRTSLDLGKWATPEARVAWAAALKRDGRVTNLETNFRTRNGELRRVLLSAELIEIAEEPCALVMTADITDRLRAEEKFAKVFQASPVAISISRLGDGRYIDVNDAFIEQFGWAREEFIGHTSVEIGLWPNPELRGRWIAELQRTGRIKNYETTLNTKSGQQRTVLVSAERIQLDGEECLIGMVHDVTERLAAEAALRESEAQLREAQRIGRIGSWDLDFARRHMVWSDEVYRIYERAPGSFDGSFRSLLEMAHPDDRPKLQALYKGPVSRDDNHEIEHRTVTPAGTVKHLRVHWEMFRDANGKPVRAVGTAQDITEQTQARMEIQRLNDELEMRVRERTAQLQSANRELESFAYSISHDLRAPLRGIDGFSHLLAEEYGERLDETGRGYLERVRRAAQRMGNLIDDILELSRVSRQEMRRVPVDLSQLAAELLEERARAEPGHPVQVSIAQGCSATGDPQLLRVLMQNLLENAWKYSAKNPAPRIEFGCAQEGNETVFFVRDNGVGFDMKYAERLFSPFQRLHSPEEFEGTGIGLATVSRIASRHGGRVWAQAETGKGAILRFTLENQPSGERLA